MKFNPTRKGLSVLALAAVLVVGAAACGDDDDSASSDTTAAPTTAAPDASMTGTFGSACSAIPTDGEGSEAGMADDPVATAASNNPVLSTLVTAVTEAELGDTLNSAENITVFAPANSAFEALDPATLKAAMDDPKGLLSTVLTYHVVGERLSPDQLAGEHKTLQGEMLTVAGSDEDFTVNDKNMIVCGNVQTANATVYIIDGVLLPPSAA
jgi:uncharacterized surface protein with fasciclin (FAS1) repeats